MLMSRMRFVITFGLMTFVTVLGYSAASAKNWHQLLRSAASPAVIYLEIELQPEVASENNASKNYMRGGTAFIISPNGYAITAGHVVEKDKETEAKYRVGPKRALEYPGGPLVATFSIIDIDEARDLAVIKLNGGRNNWPRVPVDYRSISEPDDELYTLGYPLGRELTSASGEFSRTGDGDDLITSLNLNPGFSGAPVLTRSGCVIGIVVTKDANTTTVRPTRFLNSRLVNVLGDENARTDSTCYNTDYVQTERNDLKTSVEKLNNANIALYSQVDKLQQDISVLQKTVGALKIPTSGDYYVKPIPSKLQDTEETCNDNDILISAACTNQQGSQAAVGPIFRMKDGKRSAFCARYGGERWNADGQIICLKQK